RRLAARFALDVRLRSYDRQVSTTANAALASATIVRPDAGTLSPALEPAIRAACLSAWRGLELVLAGSALRGRIADASDPRLRERLDAVLAMFGDQVALRRDALVELRAARRNGAFEASLDMAALVASCGRVGDAPAVSAGRRRVRTLALEALPRTMSAHRAFATVLRESAMTAFLVDAARAIYRHATRGDRELARWAIAPTGSTSREQALIACAELVGSTELLAQLDRQIALELDEPSAAEPPVHAAPAAAEISQPPPPVASEPAASHAPAGTSSNATPPIADEPHASPASQPDEQTGSKVDEPLSESTAVSQSSGVASLTPTKSELPVVAASASPAAASLADATPPRESPPPKPPERGSSISDVAPSRSVGWLTPSIVILAVIVAAALLFLR
ncbi:MAG: hypothetical protein JWO36_5086, partial [Myxococcales bacterium]|nr:hypothetical protein [Myxococcales bacterium]